MFLESFYKLNWYKSNKQLALISKERNLVF